MRTRATPAEAPRGRARQHAHLGLALLAVLVVAAPRRATAQEEHEARRYADAGDQAFRLGRYLVAATAYEEAYRRAPLPALVFSAAQAYRRQYFVDRDPARLSRARALYQQYLDAVPEGGRREHAVTHLQTIDLLLAHPDEAPASTEGSVAPPAPPAPPETQLMVVSHVPAARASIDGAAFAPVPVIRAVAPGRHRVRVEAPGFFPASQEWVAVDGRLVVAAMELGARPARLSVRAPAGAAIVLDGRPVGIAPLARPLLVAPGPHRVVATARGREPLDETLSPARGESVTIVGTMPVTAQRHVAWSLLAGAGVALASASVTAGLAWAAESRAGALADVVEEDRRNLSDAERARYEDDVHLRDDLRTTSVVLGASALALAAGWALAYFFDLPEPDRSLDVR